ncbi:MAG: valine--tRNA ligase [Candidatus Yanofskybacteria bacterium RIFCSPHIGHO2_02_FULL_41_29]|uniref:Valine--tRNA ligase n=1 Tax=Candidatus Yanofskybacteria bacterium RIFCSPHIGHO2_01_FULL_41_53 TaxID=1802663 RepID=A0A1F8EMC2_9BACT|nr:MAG: valine--tRNA ligase [Candidatus Yanofskybacteria bacterium RIFCSPHIGHO2_01_FULL_41_53]OGN11693.1 MAG: valine--tRNA ligase [Candidatus Yanofskybacteria bacterium RIFCSPHIGHO2_02_FULL_41_29]OGN19182.1 MAG: valine--tRNA ligase [Candidatus Yanofskybacteria bacterium RIFCSPHIGHO2_12_FULL_41_9]OGN24442.1 MAG: valine--tRNA ligase [Candidatus Yanofskybacteria bacterium RIFCSPLOWO2_01_FULL_41_67]OGN30330.1 MAG: valine--tRNA ligase [Candidatus Yanofskybacteria bacterium RIFCSPLOWO2_02_FULL_41_13]
MMAIILFATMMSTKYPNNSTSSLRAGSGQDLPKAYNPKETEDRIYKLWEESGYFNPDNLPKRHKKPFSIVLPPPNVTAALHMGSALMLAIEDVMIRFERMRGKKALWLPGTDHASIATEEKFLKDTKISKRDYVAKRQEFIDLITEFALKNQTIILGQMRAMGSSLDWSRLKFTLDPDSIDAVHEAFIRMYNMGLIYMGSGKVVNWDPRGQTVVSDDEIEYEPGKATLYTFRYSKDFPVAISTTRPETKVGDTAVAVHPDDERYKRYINRTFSVNFTGVNLSIKIVGDPSVDPAFGTGAVGVTPAHSLADSEIASRHNLPSQQVINEYARMNKEAGPLLSDKKTMEARKIIIDHLRKQGLIEKEEIVDQNIPKAQRSGGIIEPLPKKHQFFVNVNKPVEKRNGKTIRELLKEVVEAKKIKILPERFEKVYLNWVENLRDWSISRQIWYGIRPPVWYKPQASADDNLEYTVSKTKPAGEGWEQFNDTLDTWFSSGLWTFSTLGWPKKTGDLKTYHPTDVLETAYDIIFFWVARMILMSQVLIGEIPFKTVYLHGLVRDEKGRKISKSLGNNIDPVSMINEYGADAVRMAMIIGTSAGNDSKVSSDKFRAYKHFANKLWNISRFILMNIPETEGIRKAKLTEQDKKIAEEQAKLIKDITQDMENFRFYLAGEKTYHYVWHTFADKIIEESKEKLASKNPEIKASTQKILLELLINSLKILHPFMPFVTEEIYSKIPGNKGKILMIEEWPS